MRRYSRKPQNKRQKIFYGLCKRVCIKIGGTWRVSYKSPLREQATMAYEKRFRATARDGEKFLISHVQPTKKNLRDTIEPTT